MEELNKIRTQKLIDEAIEGKGNAAQDNEQLLCLWLPTTTAISQRWRLTNKLDVVEFKLSDGMQRATQICT